MTLFYYSSYSWLSWSTDRAPRVREPYPRFTDGVTEVQGAEGPVGKQVRGFLLCCALPSQGPGARGGGTPSRWLTSGGQGPWEVQIAELKAPEK